jgi:hypothetical protein
MHGATMKTMKIHEMCLDTRLLQTDVEQVGQRCPPQYSFPLFISKYNIILLTLSKEIRQEDGVLLG